MEQHIIVKHEDVKMIALEAKLFRNKCVNHLDNVAAQCQWSTGILK